jgi:hypothetical protein
MTMTELTAVVAILDGVPDSEGDTFDADTLQIPDESVSVRYNFDLGMPIGVATFKRTGDKLLANIALRDGLLVGGLLAKGLYPALGGSIGSTVKREDGSSSLMGVKITCLGLCETGNTDKRIEPINLTK